MENMNSVIGSSVVDSSVVAGAVEFDDSPEMMINEPADAIKAFQGLIAALSSVDGESYKAIITAARKARKAAGLDCGEDTAASNSVLDSPEIRKILSLDSTGIGKVIAMLADGTFRILSCVPGKRESGRGRAGFTTLTVKDGVSGETFVFSTKDKGEYPAWAETVKEVKFLVRPAATPATK